MDALGRVKGRFMGQGSGPAPHVHQALFESVLERAAPAKGLLE